VRLELVEGRSNDEVRAAVKRCDIVAEQFIAGFGLFAIEGMSAGKPVLSALGWMPEEVRSTELMRGCPIVDVDVEGLEQGLARLAADPGRREALGRAGRDFAIRHHSYEATGRVWSALLDHVWRGRPIPDVLRP
jgi:glycosyltransferase involved in cell wall biosynthesis